MNNEIFMESLMVVTERMRVEDGEVDVCMAGV